MSLAAPHLVLDGFSTALGKRVATVLRHLLPPPKSDTQRVLTFANREDHISFRHHTWSTERGNVELAEVGPRFELSMYRLQLGTIDMKEADNEWVRRDYKNTASKRTYL